MIWLSVSLLLVYRNACDFCTLSLYPETLLKLFIRSRSPLTESPEFSRYTIILSVKRENLTSSFLVWMDAFYFFLLPECSS